MLSLNNIVNLDLHPLNKSEKYLKKCKKKLKKDSVLQLNNFLSSQSLNNIQKEAKILHSKAFYCSQNHTIFLTKKNNNLSDDDPCNIEVKSNKGCVPHDLIPSNSNLRTLYNSNDFNHDVVMNRSWSGPSEVGSQTQRDYIDGLIRNPISLCPRGSGIDSVRLIETCFYRRVPVLISDYDYFMVGEDHYDTSFCFRICHPYMTEDFFVSELKKIYNLSLDELRERAELARKYFEEVIRVYFDDPTLYFLNWLRNGRH